MRRPLSAHRAWAFGKRALIGSGVVGAAVLACVMGSVTSGAGAGAATTATAAPGATSTTAPAPAPSTPTDSWLQRATAAEASLGSVRIVGNFVHGKSITAFSLLVNGDGEGGGTFTEQGSQIQIKRVGPLLYFNAPKQYWAKHSNVQQTKKYGGQWIEVSALDSRFQSFDQFLNARDIAASVFQGYTHPLTVSKPTALNGRKVVIVSDSAAANGQKSSVAMYIAATGKPYVLKIVDKGLTQSTTLNFTSYGNPVAITTPPEPINLS